MLAGMQAALQECATAPDVRCVVLTGAGGAFCAGGDVKGMAEGSGADLTYERRAEGLRGRMEVVRLIHDSNRPSVAAISGAAAGAGLSLAMACDFRIAGRSAKLTTAFAKVGLSGDFGGTWFLTQLVGTAKARELYLTSPVLTAQQALDLGLVTQVVDDDAVDATAQALARQLADGPRITLGYIKQNLNDAQTGSLAHSLDREAERHTRCAFTEDHREAASAFVEKRKPVFTGR